MMKSLENNCHRYLNLPFKILPPEYFNEWGSEIIHLDCNELDYYQVDDWLNSLNLKCHLKECFYTPPHSKLPIHTDELTTKINITWGPTEGVTRWWESKNAFHNEDNQYGGRYKKILWAKENESTLIYEANTNRPSLINVQELHSTYNPTDIGRWTLCFAPATMDDKLIIWDDALKIFKDYIEYES